MISIIVPAYNVQEYLPDCIESILEQNVQGEIIIVNDGSQDNTLTIAKKYEKDRPDVIQVIDQVNKGLASARNTGIMNAYFDWCLFLDADDMLVDGAIKKIEQTILDTNVDIISGSFKTFGTSNEEIILMPDPKLEDFRTGNRIGSSSAVRTSALKSVGGFNPKMVEGYEDLALWCDLLSRGSKIVTIPSVVWLYRTKEKSMWKDITPEIHKKLLAQINKDVPEAQLNF